MDFAMPGPDCGQPETRPELLYKVHFTYFSLILFVIGSLTILVVSFMTTPRKNFEVMAKRTGIKIMKCKTKSQLQNHN